MDHDLHRDKTEAVSVCKFKETKDGIKTVIVHICVTVILGKHCIKLGVSPFLPENVSVFLTSLNCSRLYQRYHRDGFGLVWKINDSI